MNYLPVLFEMERILQQMLRYVHLVDFSNRSSNAKSRTVKTYLHITGEMVRQARVLAQATSDLVNAMRSDAEAEIDMENSKKLLAAAKLLADSTARMVEAAKVWGN